MKEKQKIKVKQHCPALNNPEPPALPSLRFSPTAWAKLLFLRDYGESEVGGFGISASDDLLYVEDVQLVKQVCSWAHVAFDDESVADHFDVQVEEGRQPEQFSRLWIHTHPGDCPEPSGVDEECFDRVFGRSDWAVMFILARGGRSFARLRFNVGPGGHIEIPVSVDYSQHFAASDHDAWQQQYLANVEVQQFSQTAVLKGQPPVLGSSFDNVPVDEWQDSWSDYVDDDFNLRGFTS